VTNINEKNKELKKEEEDDSKMLNKVEDDSEIITDPQVNNNNVEDQAKNNNNSKNEKKTHLKNEKIKILSKVNLAQGENTENTEKRHSYVKKKTFYDFDSTRHAPQYAKNLATSVKDVTETYTDSLTDIWHNLPGELFRVRQKDYFQQKENGKEDNVDGKGPSGSCIYETLEIVKHRSNDSPDLLTEKMLFENFDLNFNDKLYVHNKIKLPQYLIINVSVPIFNGVSLSFTGISNNTKGPCCNVTCICELSELTRKRFLDGKTTEADRLLSNFLYDPKNTTADAPINRRLKCINRLSNKQEFTYGLNTLIHKYNGVPFLIRDSTSFVTDSSPKRRWAIVNVNVNCFGRIAKKGLWSVRGHAKSSVMDICMVVEGDGNNNDELPENVIVAWRLSHFNVFDNKDLE